MGYQHGGGGGFDRRPREMHKVTCSECKKECEVPFKPSGDRPVYCKECFAKRRDSGRQKKNFASLSLLAACKSCPIRGANFAVDTSGPLFKCPLLDRQHFVFPGQYIPQQQNPNYRVPLCGMAPRQKEGMLARNNYSYQKHQKELAKKKKKEEKKQRKLNKENMQVKEDPEQVS